MSEISCNIVKDLMPLYIDGVVSDETAEKLQEHMEECNGCREEHRELTQNLLLPSNRNIQEENSKVLKDFKFKLRVKKIMISCTSVIITVLIIVVGYMVFQNVSVVHDYFSPVMMVSLSDGQMVDDWRRVRFDEKDHLIFDSVFYSKEVANDANSNGIVEIRISDTTGKVIVDKLAIDPGKGADLNQLERNTEYIVEVKSGAEFALLRFY